MSTSDREAKAKRPTVPRLSSASISSCCSSRMYGVFGIATSYFQIHLSERRMRPQNQHGNLTAAQHLVGDTAYHPARPRTAAVRCHGDQVDTMIDGVIHDCMRGLPVREHRDFGFQPIRAQRTAD